MTPEKNFAGALKKQALEVLPKPQAVAREAAH
jgi:hypothetical protein